MLAPGAPSSFSPVGTLRDLLSTCPGWIRSQYLGLSPTTGRVVRPVYDLSALLSRACSNPGMGEQYQQQAQDAHGDHQQDRAVSSLVA